MPESPEGRVGRKTREFIAKQQQELEGRRAKARVNQAQRKRDRQELQAIKKARRTIQRADDSQLPELFSFLERLQTANDFRDVSILERIEMMQELGQREASIKERALQAEIEFDTFRENERRIKEGGDLDRILPRRKQLVSARQGIAKAKQGGG